jgi:hypothetical protein
MPNLSRRYEKSGFAALISPDKKTVLNVIPVTANQIYNVIGMTVVFAETKAALQTLCTTAGYDTPEKLFT